MTVKELAELYCELQKTEQVKLYLQVCEKFNSIQEKLTPKKK